jgi:phosphoglycolate phosphatase
MLMADAKDLIDGSRAVVFDLDGTLVDTLDDLWLALNSALDHHGLPPASLDVVLANVHGGLAETARAALSSVDRSAICPDEPVDTYQKHYRLRGHAGSRLYPGARDFLERCNRRRQAIAICTNKPTADARDLLSLMGVAGYFDVVVGIDACGAAKPDPAPLQLVLEQLDCAPVEAVFIGDSVIDAQCAKGAGVPFLLHEAGYGADAALAFGCAARFRTYGELIRCDQKVTGLN